ncbi:dipeptide ABC transporter ATP-binding protein [Salinisphaera sp. RV14]|uniref:dipeptide ABC transporter ATP-binding protein n=1 Tax=unclassified Salinisphaera TaxID=2649847 RepID=UPI003F8465F3
MSEQPVLKATDLTRHYDVGGMGRRAKVQALTDVSFSLSAGQTLAVVGESGCGKSTLARLVALIETADHGDLEIAGENAAAASRATRKRLRQSVQMVFQDPYGSLNPRKKIGSILEEPLVINTRLKRSGRREKALAIMQKVGLRPEHYDRYPHMFSGGQRQRVAIARALMLNPLIVVADEPVSALDVSIQAQVLNLFADLQDELQLAYLFIAHDLSVVHHFADEIMVMYLGRAVEKGPSAQVFEAPAHPYTMALLGSTPAVDPARRGKRVAVSGEPPSPMNPPPGCAFHLRCPYATDVCRQDRPALRRFNKRLVACHHAEAIAADKQPSARPAVAES